jgi:hypothetical protein
MPIDDNTMTTSYTSGTRVLRMSFMLAAAADKAISRNMLLSMPVLHLISLSNRSNFERTIRSENAGAQVAPCWNS